jgi:predicted regulator of Ras-like GTPase activity (Roadblock/LC7/MglB family)
MAGLPGVVGCALVETETGMVWQSAGGIDELTVLAEAASDYWRLHHRLQTSFERLGKLRACVMMHAAGRITLLPCGSGTLLVAVTHEPSGVDWRQWQVRTRQLAAIVDGTS